MAVDFHVHLHAPQPAVHGVRSPDLSCQAAQTEPRICRGASRTLRFTLHAVINPEARQPAGGIMSNTSESDLPKHRGCFVAGHLRSSKQTNDSYSRERCSMRLAVDQPPSRPQPTPTVMCRTAVPVFLRETQRMRVSACLGDKFAGMASTFGLEVSVVDPDTQVGGWMRGRTHVCAHGLIHARLLASPR